MADLFGDWIPGWVIGMVIAQARENPHHTFIFLTKNPSRYQELKAWPLNCWLGTTITNQADADERIPELLKAEAQVRFVSLEPMLGPVNLKLFLPCPESKPQCSGWNRQNQLYLCEEDCEETIDWLIIGAMTGPGAKKHQVKPEWVHDLTDQARPADVPIFLKDNLKWPERIQEWPK